MKIAVVGTGYVGLVTGTCFAETGNDVVCVDNNASKVQDMKAGQIPIFEPDLEELFHRNIEEGRLRFTTDLAKGIEKAEIIFLALPTPPGADGAADLSYILGVADELGSLLKSYTAVVDKSTVPVGTAEQVRQRIAKGAKVRFDVVSNPEFLREGFAVNDFMNPNRIVIGTNSQPARKLLEKLYAPFLRQGSPLYFMDERSAEMAKYAANAFLATKISFMNEIANLCELTSADVDAVRLSIGADERIGQRFLFPGIGYGGSCFPKDVVALQRTAAEQGYDFQILSAVSSVNRRQKQRLAAKISKYYSSKLKDKKFALWGLAFKPDTDDIREAPVLEIIDALTTAGAQVAAYDPEAMPNAQRLLSQNKRLTFGDSAYDALKGADALIIVTEWAEFRSPDFAVVKQLLKQPVIFDGRNLYDLKTMSQLGFYYNSIGRKVIN